MAKTQNLKWSRKAGDVFVGPDETEPMDKEILGEQSSPQHLGDPEDYGYPALRWHHYWGIVNGEYVILTREPNSTHPANGRWAMWAEGMRPLGVEPPGRTEVGED